MLFKRVNSELTSLVTFSKRERVQIPELSNIHCEMFLLILRNRVRIMMTLYIHCEMFLLILRNRDESWSSTTFCISTVSCYKMCFYGICTKFHITKLCANWTPNKRQFQCGISDNSNVDFGIVIVNALFLQVLYHMMKSPYSPWLQEHLEL